MPLLLFPICWKVAPSTQIPKPEIWAWSPFHPSLCPIHPSLANFSSYTSLESVHFSLATLCLPGLEGPPSLLGHLFGLSLYSCSSTIHSPHTRLYPSKPLWRKSKCLKCFSHAELLLIPGQCQILSISTSHMLFPLPGNPSLPSLILWVLLGSLPQRCLSGLDALAMSSITRCFTLSTPFYSSLHLII